MKFLPRALAAALILFAPCAPIAAQDSKTAAPPESAAAPAPAPSPAWPFEASDLPVDPDFVFGTLPNGMRYILRENATPEGTALVRMRIGSGSLEEREDERGLAHFLEHMAFNGSSGIPEGEMVKLLEREGLAFGADTNAATGFDSVTYMLNLPRNEAALLDTALMLMRETASELTIAEDAVERERGVILAERRDRQNYAQRAQQDAFEFLAPDALYPRRLPIGSLDVLESADAARLRALYQRTYTPANTVLVIVGDYPVAVMEEAILARFSDWSGPPAPPMPDAGPIDATRAGEVDTFLDPALSETVTLTMLAPWIDRPDTRAAREAALLEAVAYGIIQRRLARLAREEDAPFRGARYARGDIFEAARSNSLVIASEDGQWREGMIAAVNVVNEALTHGFSEAEVAEQLANIRTALENGVAGAGTRANSYFAQVALNLVAEERVPTTPAFQLAEFERAAPTITPAAVHAALLETALPLQAPLIRFQGRSAPDGGEAALREAFAQGMALPVAPPDAGAAKEFAYSDFGEPGTVISDTREERLGFRYVTFANGLRLTLKATDIREDRIAYRLSLDGGSLMNTADDPLRTYLVSTLPSGGLGRHSADELQTILAGRSVGFSVANTADSFSFMGGTTRRDFDLQMQVLAAALTDPGYRPEGVARFRRGIDDFFASLNATPASAYSAAVGAILSGNDPRYSLQPREAYEALTFEALEAAIADRWANGALELALVGDLDEEAAIAAVAATLGALPPRETAFQPRDEARTRSFAPEHAQYVLRHKGEADQALLRIVWPTDDDSDFAEEMRMELLARVVRIALTERLREELGQTYSPSASSSMSRIHPGYGVFVVSASVDVAEVEATRSAITDLVGALIAAPLDADIVDRARQPLLEAYDNALKSLDGWMNLADRAQSQPERLERWFDGPGVLRAITPEDLRDAAARYLAPSGGVEFLVVPEGEAP